MVEIIQPYSFDDDSTYVPYTGATSDVDLNNKKLSNARRVPRPTTFSTSPYFPDIATADVHDNYSLGGALTFANHTSAWTFQPHEIVEINLLGTVGYALTFSSDYVAYHGLTLPTTTVANVGMKILLEFDNNLNKLVMISAT